MNELNKRPTNIPAGAIFTISTGTYSDYYVSGVFRAVKEIPTTELLEAYLTEHPKQRGDYAFEPSRFLAWVGRQGFLEPLESWEWHLTDYSRANEMTLEGPTSYEPLIDEPNP